MNRNRRRVYQSNGVNFNYSWLSITKGWDYLSTGSPGIVPLYLPNGEFGLGVNEYYIPNNPTDLGLTGATLGKYMYVLDGSLYTGLMGTSYETALELNLNTMNFTKHNTSRIDPTDSSYTFRLISIAEFPNKMKVWSDTNWSNPHVFVSSNLPELSDEVYHLDLSSMHGYYESNNYYGLESNAHFTGNDTHLYVVIPNQTNNYTCNLSSFNLSTGELDRFVTLDTSGSHANIVYGYTKMIYVPNSDKLVLIAGTGFGWDSKVYILDPNTLSIISSFTLDMHEDESSLYGAHYQMSNLTQAEDKVYFILSPDSSDAVSCSSYFCTIDTVNCTITYRQMSYYGEEPGITPDVIAGMNRYPIQNYTSSSYFQYLSTDSVGLTCNKVVTESSEQYVFNLSGSMRCNYYSIGTEGDIWLENGGGRYGQIIYTGLGEY